MTEPSPSVGGDPAGGVCANCEERLTGPFCSRCGQLDRDPARIGAAQIVREWLGDLFTFDSRVLRTLWPLVSRPGFLTAEYLAGRRVRYVPPFRLFVFLSLVMFLVLSFTGVNFSYEVTRGDEQVVAHGRHATKAGDAAVESGGEGGVTVVDGAAAESGELDLLDDVDEVNRRILDRSPQVMLVLAPLLGFFVWLLHRRRVPYYMSHLVFSLHVHGFWFVVTTVAAVIDLPWPEARPGTALVLLTFVPYLFLAQRRVYGGGWLANLARTALLALAQGVAWIGTMAVLVLLTVLGA